VTSGSGEVCCLFLDRAAYNSQVFPKGITRIGSLPFRYKHELDPAGIPQFGLVAEQVEKVNPDLVARDEQGKPYTVRYEAINAMLLNEFLKEHQKVEDQATTITHVKSTVAKQEATITQLESGEAQQQKEIQALTANLREQAAQLQKVSARLATDKPAPRVVVNGE
jgi:hypothetical protein